MYILFHLSHNQVATILRPCKHQFCCHGYHLRSILKRSQNEPKGPSKNSYLAKKGGDYEKERKYSPFNSRS